MPTTRPTPPRSAYDVRRALSYPRPRWRGRLHLVSFYLSLGLGMLLVVAARGARATTAVAVYAASLAGLFGASALYHRGTWPPAVHRWLQRLDHVMIFMLIAGTATPVLLLGTQGAFGTAVLGAIWGVALVGLVLHMVWLDAPELLVGAVYVGLGWLGILAVPAIWRQVGAGVLALVLAGGLLYSLGALGYHRRWPDPAPEVFGFHEVFHSYVCAAAACHYAAIALLVA